MASTEQERDIENGFKQWKFVHGLIKSMVHNTLRCIVYLRLTPEKVPYIKCMRDVKDEKLRRIYVSFVKAIEEHQRIRHNDKKISIMAFQMLMTIFDTDHTYKKLVYDMISKYENLTKEEIDKFEETEIPTKVRKENFVVQKMR